jgi:hypothetical protein
MRQVVEFLGTFKGNTLFVTKRVTKSWVDAVKTQRMVCSILSSIQGKIHQV